MGASGDLSRSPLGSSSVYAVTDVHARESIEASSDTATVTQPEVNKQIFDIAAAYERETGNS